MQKEDYVLSGFTALRAIRKLRIAGYSFKAQEKKEICVPPKEEIQKIQKIFNYSTENPHHQFKNSRILGLNFLVHPNYWKKSHDNAVITRHSGSWKGLIARPIHDKQYQWTTNKAFEIPVNLLIVSPAFLLLQLSSFLSFEELLLLALEFCGTYTVGRNFYDTTNDTSACSNTTNDISASSNIANPNSASSNTTNDIGEPKLYTGLQPIMNLKDLETIIQMFNNCRMNGMAKLKKVAKYLRPFSASPMESRLYVNLTLPTRYGGFNLPNLKFNCSIQLSSVAASVAQQQTVIVDLCDVRSKTIIEYDSRAFHSAIDQSQKDKRRRDGLEIDKFKCFSITTEQINNFNTFYNYAKQIMHSIKGRARIRAKNFEEVAFAEYSVLRKASFEIAML